MEKVIYKDRKNTNSVKWDGTVATFGKECRFPMWVADMDFEVPKCVQKSLEEYVSLGTFGYYKAAEEYYDAFVRWEEKYHGYRTKKDWLRFAPGVVPAVNWLVQILTDEDEAVLIMPPVYYPFRNAIENNRRRVVNSPLIKNGGSYAMNVSDVGEKIVSEDVKLLILCSPHNPVGRVWTKDELKALLDVCKKNGVYVISDEIHQDIVFGENVQIPAATVGDYDSIMVTLTAATKTFNLASCQNSIVIIPDGDIRKRYDEFSRNIGCSDGNAFGYVAVGSAYRGGREWLDAVLGIIEGNYRYVKARLSEALPKVVISELQGTYLMWIDIGAYVSPEEIEDFITCDCSMGVDFGSWFGGEDYAGFIRLNLATRRENIEEATEVLIEKIKERMKSR